MASQLLLEIYRYHRLRHLIDVLEHHVLVIRVRLVGPHIGQAVEAGNQRQIVGARRLDDVDADLDAAERRNLAFHAAHDAGGLLDGFRASILELEQNNVGEHV